MDNSQDQPLPPGIHFLPNYSSAVPSVSFPPQHGDITVRPQYHPNYYGNYPFPSSNSTFTLTQGSYLHNSPSTQYNLSPNAPDLSGQIPQNFETDNALQLSLTQQGADLIKQQSQDQDTAVEKNPKHKDGTIPQLKGHFDGNGNDSTGYSRLHVENARDIETAAQDAVLREQVAV